MSLRELILALLILTSPLSALADGDYQPPQTEEQQVEEEETNIEQHQSQTQNNITIEQNFYFNPQQDYYCGYQGCEEPILPYRVRPRRLRPIDPDCFQIRNGSIVCRRDELYVRPGRRYRDNYYGGRHDYRRRDYRHRDGRIPRRGPYRRSDSSVCTIHKEAKNKYQVVLPLDGNSATVLFEGVRENAKYMLEYYKRNQVCPADFSKSSGNGFDI